MLKSKALESYETPELPQYGEISVFARKDGFYVVDYL